MSGAAPLLAIVGPTCTGKTGLAVQLARRLAPAELINADSRQLRRGLTVGTNAPTAAELGGVRCHLLEEAEPGAEYSVADWLRSAEVVLADLRRRAVEPIVAGGTGLYVTALIDGYDLGAATPDPRLRAARSRRVATASGLAVLAAEVAERDPAGARSLDLRNPRRVVRALELIDARGSVAAARGSAPRPALLIGLDAPRDEHTCWVERRCQAMFDGGGIIDETRRALERGCTRTALQRSGIGYAEALSVLDGVLSRDAAIAATVRRTLRYAKAQRTYFRRDRRIHWLDARDQRAVQVQSVMELRRRSR